MSTCVIKFDPRTISSAVYILDADVRGALFSLLLEMWCHEGHIEHHENNNARRCGLRPSRYRKIIAKLIKDGMVDVIDSRLYPGRYIQRGMRRVGITPDQRARVFAQQSQCAYCGTTEGRLDVEHIFPASRGGTNHHRNLTLACFPCNSAKRDWTLHELAGLNG